jgi:uncharacterized membrane protein YccC
MPLPASLPENPPAPWWHWVLLIVVATVALTLTPFILAGLGWPENIWTMLLVAMVLAQTLGFAVRRLLKMRG